MIEMIIDLLTTSGTIPVMVVILMFVLAVIYFQSHYILRTKVKLIESECVAKVERSVDKKILEIEEMSFIKSKELMNARWDEAVTCQHGETSNTCILIKKHYDLEMDRYRDIMHSTLDKVRETTLQHIAINGFKDLQPLEFEQYCAEVGKDIFTDKERMMKVRGIDDLILLNNTSNIRFTEEQVISAYRDVAKDSIRFEKEKQAKINELYNKLKIGGKIFGLIKSYLDD